MKRKNQWMKNHLNWAAQKAMHSPWLEYQWGLSDTPPPPCDCPARVEDEQGQCTETKECQGE